MPLWKRLLGHWRGSAADLQLESGSLRDSLVLLLTRLQKRSVDSALVGGVALAAHGVVRGTRDLDFLVPAEQEPAVHEVMQELGFEVLARGASVSSYVLEHLRVDFLLARREYGRRMLERAGQVSLARHLAVKVVQVEDLIALKLQALVSDPRRGRDRADVEALLRSAAATVNMDQVRDYARAIGAERELDEILDIVRR